MSNNKQEVVLTAEEKRKANKWDYANHFIGCKFWYRSMIEVRKDSKGNDRVLYGKQIATNNNIPVYEELLDIHFKVPLWMILTHEFLRLELQKRASDVKNGKEPEEYVYYGKYDTLRKYLLECAAGEERRSLEAKLTDSYIRNSIRRAAESGFLIVEYDYEVNFDNIKEMIAEGRNFRSIRVNHDKLSELSVFDLDPEYKLKDNEDWKKYHRCSREHKWMKKRIISSLKKLSEELKVKEKKAAFKKKLAALNLKLKNAFDILKVFVITKQCDQYTPYKSVHDNLTALKSKKAKSFSPPPEDEEYYLSDDEAELLNWCYANI